MLRTDSSVLRIDDPTDNIAIKQIVVNLSFFFLFLFFFFFLAGSDCIRWFSAVGLDCVTFRSKFKLHTPRARINFGVICNSILYCNNTQ
jgi:hypothetical protein